MPYTVVLIVIHTDRPMNRCINRPILAVCFLLSIASASIAQTGGIQTDVPAIKHVFADHFTFGCLLSYPHVGFPTDPVVPGQSGISAQHGGALVLFHMNSMGPGNNMKPQYTVNLSSSSQRYNAASNPTVRDSLDIHPVVAFNGNLIAQLNWAQRNGFGFRGHTLVWHSQTPGTAFFRTGYSASGERLSKERMTLRLENYIKEVIRLIHEGWPGLVIAMDVVNEAVNDSGGDRTTDSEWYQTFGDTSYLLKSFEFTRKYADLYGETQMKLYYNDYNTHNAAKADGIVRIMTPVWEAGYLDGIGMQQHDQTASPTFQQWLSAYHKYAAISNEISITELDVRPIATGVQSEASLQQQARQYGMFFKLFMDYSAGSGRGKIVNVTKDGLKDDVAFVQNASLWDANYQVKPAFWEVVNVGMRYNAIDSLRNLASSLNEHSYTTDSWSALLDALVEVGLILNQNYNSTHSKATSEYLADAVEILEFGMFQLKATSLDKAPEVVDHISLFQNYPNPFNPSTVISYQLSIAGNIRLSVHDVLGREVAVMVDGMVPSGRHQVTFNSDHLGSGTYLIRLQSAGQVLTRKMLLVR